MQKLIRRNYIHTLEYFARSLLCGWWLKVVRGKDGAASLKTLFNNLDATLTLAAKRTKHACICQDRRNFINLKQEQRFLPIAKAKGFHADNQMKKNEEKEKEAREFFDSHVEFDTSFLKTQEEKKKFKDEMFYRLKK